MYLYVTAADFLEFGWVEYRTGSKDTFAAGSVNGYYTRATTQLGMPVGDVKLTMWRDESIGKYRFRFGDTIYSHSGSPV